MPRYLKILLTSAAAVLLIIFGLIIVLDLFLPSIIASQIKSRTGYSLDIKDSSINLASGNIQIEGIKLENPMDLFEVPNFLDVNEIKVSVKPMSLLKDRIVADNILLDIAAVTFVKNASNEDNINTFVERLKSSFGGHVDDTTNQAETPAQEASSNASSDEKEDKQFLIKTLTLRLKTIEAMLYDDSGKPITAKSSWQLDKTFNDIQNDNVRKVVTPLISDMTARGLSLFAQIAVQKGMRIVPDAEKALEGTVKDAAGAVKDGAEGAVNAIKGLFGN